MDIEVFKLMIYSYGFDAEAIHKECFSTFRRKVIEQFGIEPSSSQFTNWIIELNNQITSFQIIANDEADLTDLILSLKATELMKEKDLLIKEAG